MSFRDIEINDYYITEDNDIPAEFYNIVMPESIFYKRAAGFFSSSALISISKGLREFYYNGGKEQLLISHILSEEDCAAINNGYKAREDVLYESLVKDFDINNILDNDGCNFLAWLIYENRLEIKVVTPKNPTVNRHKLFHDKFFILYDEYNNKVSSRGTSNETKNGLEDNYETIEVDFSWDETPHNRTKQREEQFDRLWNNDTTKWVVDDFPEVLKKKLIKIRREIPKEYIPFDENDELTDFIETPDTTINVIGKEKKVCMPSFLDLREYQKKALKKWLENDANGIYEMATGTGKTYTAISSMVKLIQKYNEKDSACGVVIIVPYKVLLEQWMDILKTFNFSPTPCYESTKAWTSKVIEQIDLFNKGFSKNFCLITTNKTFSEEPFQECLKKIERDYIFCADEMHHLATNKALATLPNNATYKLGLSATLMTKYSNEKMDRLKEYFGGVVFEFTMKEAIGKYLTPYNYHPVFVELTEDELEEYLELSRKISKVYAQNGGEFDDDNKGLTALLSQRARLIASAKNKINKLLEFKDIIKNSNFSLFYCGDKVEIENNEKFIDRVNNLLENEIGISIRKFTAEQNKKQRENILNLFSNGIIQGLSAIRCLDEGVDIPQLRRAFILSSGTNPKEFIQRRGRILRKAEGKTIADIYDFIVFPVTDKNRLSLLSPDEIKFERKIIQREFERLKEFASLAENGIEATNIFLKQWELYSNGG